MSLFRLLVVATNTRSRRQATAVSRSRTKVDLATSKSLFLWSILATFSLTRTITVSRPLEIFLSNKHLHRRTRPPADLSTNLLRTRQHQLHRHQRSTLVHPPLFTTHTRLDKSTSCSTALIQIRPLHSNTQNQKRPTKTQHPNQKKTDPQTS
jgi:hypothetical protein